MVVLALTFGLAAGGAGRAQAPLAAVVAPLLTDGAVVGNWRVVFAGYGDVQYREDRGPTLTLAPAPASTPDETHAALVVSRAAFSGAARYAARVSTKRQLRIGSPPNPWETGWLVFNYTDNEHFYYLALKTNGWELGKRDPSYPGGQRFLATGAAPVAAVGKSNQVVVQTSGGTIRLTVDGRRLTTFTDWQHPYVGGSFGFYAEDARVVFDRISATQ